jgi:hypothetical protein
MKYRKLLPSFFRISSCSLALVMTLLSARQASAVPYASQIANTATDVSFLLNESADNVTMIFSNPALTNDLGPLPKGTHVFPKLGEGFKIVVSKSTGPGYLQGVTNQVSDDSNILMRFVNQRGVVVNRNPASPYFGRIYVSVTTPGTNSVSGRGVGRGIYVLNPDQTDALGQGDAPLTGGLPFGANSESPHRLSLGPDGNLYMADWSDPTGTLYVTDPNVATNASASIVLNGQGGPFPLTASRTHGSISAAWIEGSLATGDLTVYVIDEDLQSDKVTTSRTEQNSLWRWDIGAGPLPFTGTPVKVGSGPLLGIASQLADAVRGPDGKWYISQKRDDNATTTGIFVRNSDNTTTLWSSLTATREMNGSAAYDLLSSTAAIDVSPDGKYLIALKQNTNSISIFPLVDGIPNITNRIVMPTSPTTGSGRDIAFDAAGNIYSVSSGQGLLRIYSPGGTTIATTGSDGTFSVYRPPSVTVSGYDTLGTEAGPDVAAFTVTRTGDMSQGIVVRYTLTGTASNGVDYVEDPLAVEIPAGVASADVIISPINDSEAELTETVTITLIGAPEYDLGPGTSASANIVDDEYPNVIRIRAVDTNMYERLSLDASRFVFTRLGDTNLPLEVSFQYDGSAIPSVDYMDTNSGLIIFPPGSVTQTNLVFPLDDTELEGDEVVTLRVLSGPDYVPAAVDSASARLQDNELPPAKVLFSDDFNVDTSANWITQFGANSGGSDYTVTFNYDYTGRVVPPAPHSDGGTMGLLVTVNKLDGVASSAGVNLYPTGQQFSGNYALRFDMFLSFGNSNTTEHALAGINHSGLATNRYTQAADTNNTVRGGDGIWMGIVSDASDLIDYGAYTSTNASERPMVITNRPAAQLTSLFPNPPYAFPGSPTANGTNRAWADVEISQIGKIISLKVNQNLIFQVTNNFGYNSGKIMLGYNDQFDSIGSVSNFVVFDNVRVVSLDPEITRITHLENGNIQIDFICPLSINPSDFRLESTSSLSSPVWTQEGTEFGGAPGSDPGTLRAIVPRNGDARFYRIQYIR